MESKPVDAREFSRVLLFTADRIEERFRQLDDVTVALQNAQTTINQNFKKLAAILASGTPNLTPSRDQLQGLLRLRRGASTPQRGRHALAPRRAAQLHPLSHRPSQRGQLVQGLLRTFPAERGSSRSGRGTRSVPARG